MERGDLLSVNGGIFKPQGQAINDHAASDVRVLVVGNPCNTNCLIARERADVPADRWFAMTRLDENRAKTQLAKKAGVQSRAGQQRRDLGQPLGHAVPRLRARPDRRHARARGDPPTPRGSRATFIETVQKRGAAVIEKRGASSAASAAHAAIESVNSVHFATPGDDFHSVAVCSNGEYGVPEGLQFGFPVRSDGTVWSVVEGIEHDDFARGKIEVTTKELVDERDEVRSLGLIS